VIFILKNAHTVLLFETFDRRTRFWAISWTNDRQLWVRCLTSLMLRQHLNALILKTGTRLQKKIVASRWQPSHCWQSESLRLLEMENRTNNSRRTYHTRKEVAQLIFKVIDADGRKLTWWRY
jgi:hypothetical protein